MRIKTIFIILLLILPAVSYSQSRYRVRDRSLSLKKQLERDLEQALIKVGPFYIIGSLGLLDAGYNSNVQNDYEEASSDYTLKLSPSLTLITPLGRRLYIYLKGAYYYQIFNNINDLNKSSYSLGSDILLLFPYIGIFAGAEKSRYYGYYESEIDSRLSRDSDLFYINTEIKISSKVSMDLSLRRTDLSFPEAGDINTRLSRETDSYAFSISSKALPNTSFSLGYDHISHDFIQNPVYNTKSCNYIFSMQWERQNRYFLELSIIYADFQPQNISDKDYQGFLHDILLSFPIFYRIGISLSSDRDIYFSRSPENFYYISQKNGIEADYALSSGIGLLANYFYGTNTYDFPVLIDEQEIFRKDQIYSYGAGIRFKIIEDLSARIMVSKESKRSNIYLNNYDTIRVYLSTSYSF